MKTKLILLTILITGLTMFVSFNTNNLYGQDPKGKTTMTDSVKYVCPHHPDMVSNKPGTCKCGMEMIAMDKNKMKKPKDTKKCNKKNCSKDMKQEKMMKDTTKKKM